MPSTISTDQFICRARLKHGMKYDYSKIIYKNNREKIEIVCPVHGSFWQVPTNHINHGCRKCNLGGAPKSSTVEFIAKATEIHNGRYDYTNVIYKHSLKEIDIICTVHGIFKQKPNNHLLGQQCPRCNQSGTTSRAENMWLDSIGPHLIRQHKIRLLDGSLVSVDGFDPNTNTVYEYHGKYWHGHPSLFHEDDIHPTINIRCGDLYETTLNREYELRKIGYNVVSKWEKLCG